MCVSRSGLAEAGPAGRKGKFLSGDRAGFFEHTTSFAATLEAGQKQMWSAPLSFLLCSVEKE